MLECKKMQFYFMVCTFSKLRSRFNFECVFFNICQIVICSKILTDFADISFLPFILRKPFTGASVTLNSYQLNSAESPLVMLVIHRRLVFQVNAICHRHIHNSRAIEIRYFQVCVLWRLSNLSTQQ